MLVAPSILAADFNCLLEEAKSVAAADLLHIDVMDGKFVPNISLGPVVYRGLIAKVNLPLDVHLMIAHPEKYIPLFIKTGCTYLTFHYEAVKSRRKIAKLIKRIKDCNVKAGISVKPKTKIKCLKPFLKELDLVLVMSVEPGFGGQEFLSSSLKKIAYLNETRKAKGYHYLIEVDGGINKNTAELCRKEGADIAVAGTYIFKAKERESIIKELQSIN